MMEVKVVDYSPNWPRLYEEEKHILSAILKENEVAIFHIGSTSVVGLKAKPVIDILLVVKDLQQLDQQTSAFERLGYEVMGEFGLPGRRYFRKGGERRTHQIHAYSYESTQEILRHLCFCEYLRQQPEISVAYGQLKQQLASQYPRDIEKYGDGKDAFVKKIEKEALLNYWKNR